MFSVLAVFPVLSSIDENKDESYREQQEPQSRISNKSFCGVSFTTNRNHLEDYRNEDVNVDPRSPSCKRTKSVKKIIVSLM